MKERGVAIRSIVPLVLCASAAARMSLAGRSAFANHAVFSRCPASGATARGILYARSLASGRRNFSSIRKCTAPRADSAAVGTARFSSSSDTAEDDLDARVKAAVAALPQRPRCAVVGAGFAGMATAYYLATFGSDVTVFDPNEVGTGGASSVAAGLLHPLTPRGKLIWKGEEGFVAAKELIEMANAGLADAAGRKAGQASPGCVTTGKVYRPLLDEKQYDMFTKAAEALPEWVERLSREEYLEAVPGSDTLVGCLGGVRIRGALAVDSPTYLKGLWAACRGVVHGSVERGGSDAAEEGVTWVRQDVDDIHALAASGKFDAVVACVGAGVRVLAGVKDIVSLRLVRGQSLLYDNVATATSAEAEGGGKLTSAVLCGQYVVPSSVGGADGNGGKLLCGSTQEPVLSGEKLDKPADMAKALRQLAPKVVRFFPALEGVEPLGVTTGVRVIQDRNSYGRIPIAGRLPFSERGWVIAALGARGLIHHAYLGRLVAASALLDSDEHLPPQVMAPLEDLGKESTGDL